MNSTLTISSRVTITETVNLILCDGSTLTLNGRIDVPENSSITIYGQAKDSGTLVASGVAENYAGIGGGSITISGETVNSEGGNYGASIGIGRQSGGNTTCGMITLGYTYSTDTIYASNYNGTLTADKITGLAGTMLYAAYHIAVSGKDVTADKTKAKAGDVITLDYSGTVQVGYKLVYYVNDEAITGNIFTMPAENVSITAELVAITYTISYDLDGGTNSPNNPTSYTI